MAEAEPSSRRRGGWGCPLRMRMVPKVQKAYGNNTVLCNGWLLGGPDATVCLASMAMIAVPSLVWLAALGSFFARYSPVFLVAELLLLSSSLGLMFATAFSNPGIVPRQPSFEKSYDKATKQFRQKQPSRFCDVVLRGTIFRMKWCTTCNIYRPPRCTHCSVCDNCVERFDHHCPWIGTCIGKRNYWLFYCFVTATAALNCFSLITAVAHLILVAREFRDFHIGLAVVKTLQFEPLSAALVVYCVGTVWFTTGLCIFHNYLICLNQTTYEQIKGAFGRGHNPYDRGIFANFEDVLLGGIRRPYLHAYPGQSLYLQEQPVGGESEVVLAAIAADGAAAETPTMSAQEVAWAEVDPSATTAADDQEAVVLDVDLSGIKLEQTPP